MKSLGIRFVNNRYIYTLCYVNKIKLHESLYTKTYVKRTAFYSEWFLNKKSPITNDEAKVLRSQRKCFI